MKYYIYKIYDNNNTDEFYIGSTKNFSSRMSHHKKNVRNKVGKLYWCKVYQYIRASGGWDNFTKVIIEEGTCENIKFIKQKEQHYITIQKPSLNSIMSCISKEIFPIDIIKKVPDSVKDDKDDKERTNIDI